jgi:hypothetical protein
MIAAKELAAETEKEILSARSTSVPGPESVPEKRFAKDPILGSPAGSCAR